MIDFSLSDEQKALQDLAQKFTQKEITPIALKYDKEPFIPDQILKKAHAAGLMNMTTPKEYGGHGMGMVNASLITTEIHAGCAGIGGMIGINSLACGPILVGGSKEQKRRFLIPLCESGKTASFGLTERGAGSDAAGVKTKAVRKGDEYVLNGQKCFITGASYATL
jgi:acyl-CoA dehydrogenase